MDTERSGGGMIGWLLPYPSAPAAFWLRIAGETAKDGYSAARMIGVFRKSFWDLTGTAPVRSRFSDSICFVLRGCPAAERRRCILTEGSGDTGMHSCSSASRHSVDRDDNAFGREGGAYTALPAAEGCPRKRDASCFFAASEVRMRCISKNFSRLRNRHSAA